MSEREKNSFLRSFHLEIISYWILKYNTNHICQQIDALFSFFLKKQKFIKNTKKKKKRKRERERDLQIKKQRIRDRKTKRKKNRYSQYLYIIG